MDSHSLRKVNMYGRSYVPGKPLGDDFRCFMIDKILKEEGDRIPGYIPRTYVQYSKEFGVSPNTVKHIWERFCEEIPQIVPKHKGGKRHSKLQQEDLELTEVLKLNSPSLSLSEIIHELTENGVQEVSMSTVSRAIKNRMPSGQQYTRKNLPNWQENGLLQTTSSTRNFSLIIFRQKTQRN